MKHAGWDENQNTTAIMAKWHALFAIVDKIIVLLQISASFFLNVGHIIIFLSCFLSNFVQKENGL